jgi:hypothetical protein
MWTEFREFLLKSNALAIVFIIVAFVVWQLGRTFIREATKCRACASTF